jgi:cell division protein ZapB
MSAELFDELEGRITSLLQSLNELKLENCRLHQENQRLNDERGDFKSRIDSILQRLEGV